jgi:hypothetical protein
METAAGGSSPPSWLQGEFFPADLTAPLLDDKLGCGGVLGHGLSGRHEQEQNRCDAHDNSDHVRI